MSEALTFGHASARQVRPDSMYQPAVKPGHSGERAPPKKNTRGVISGLNKGENHSYPYL